MKIGLFSAKTSKVDFLANNGVILDIICKNYRITEELNGDYSATLFFYSKKGTNINYDEITEDEILKIKDEYGDEPFRIASVRKNKNLKCLCQFIV